MALFDPHLMLLDRVVSMLESHMVSAGTLLQSQQALQRGNASLYEDGRTYREPDGSLPPLRGGEERRSTVLPLRSGCACG